MFVQYEVELTKNGENNFCLSGEKLSMKKLKEGEKTRLTAVFDYQKGEKELFRPLNTILLLSGTWRAW